MASTRNLKKLLSDCFLSRFFVEPGGTYRKIEIAPERRGCVRLPFKYGYSAHDESMPHLLWDPRITDAAEKFAENSAMSFGHIKEVPLLLYVNSETTWHSFNMIIIPATEPLSNDFTCDTPKEECKGEDCDPEDFEPAEQCASLVFAYGIRLSSGTGRIQFTTPHINFKQLFKNPDDIFEIKAIEPLTPEFLQGTLDFLRQHFIKNDPNAIQYNDRRGTQEESMKIRTDLIYSTLLTNIPFLPVHNCASITAKMSTRKNKSQSVNSTAGVCFNSPGFMQSAYYTPEQLSQFIQWCNYENPDEYKMPIKWIKRVYKIMRDVDNSPYDLKFWILSFLPKEWQRRVDNELGFGKKKKSRRTRKTRKQKRNFYMN